MKLLHTADWHVGKTIRGQSRLAEHRAVLADIVRIADAESADVVLVAGDLYETAAPNPDAEALVLKTLLDLRETGAQVIVISGNHDNWARFEAVRPLFAALGVVVMGAPRRPTDGGVVEIVGRSGDSVRVALVPFLSQRGIIRTEQLMGQDAGSNVATYDERMRQMVSALVRAVCRRRGERRRRALHGDRRVAGRGRAGGADLHGLRDRRCGVPSARALRRARAPPPHAADRGRGPDLVLGLSAAGRLRRDGRAEQRARRDGRSEVPRGRSARSRCRVDVACARCGARSISCAPRPRTTATRSSASTSRGR